MRLATASGWVTRVMRLKKRCFLTLACADKDQRVVVEGSHLIAALGDYVGVAGIVQQPEAGGPDEILAERVRVDAAVVPRSDKNRIEQWSLRRKRLQVRSAMLRSLRETLAESGFACAVTPFLARAEAALGASDPFAVHLEGFGTGWLPVNHIAELIAAQAAAPRSRYAIGKLFWQHPYNNRYSLSEINTLDLTAPWMSGAEAISLVDRLVAHAHEAMLGSRAGVSAKLSFATAAGIAGLGSDKRALPIGAAQDIARRVGTDRFWIGQCPATSSPFYTSVTRSSSGEIVAENYELWIAGVPNVAAGSVWAHDEAALNTSADRALLARQQQLIGQGLPPGAGVTIGLDRLALALGGAHNVRAMLLDPRMPGTFRNAPPVCEPRQRPNTMFERGSDEIIRDDACGEVLSQAVNAFVSLGFAEVQPSALVEIGGTGEVNWYGRRVALADGYVSALGAHVTAGIDRVVAFGFVPTGDGGPMRLSVEGAAIAPDEDGYELLKQQIQATVGTAAVCRRIIVPGLKDDEARVGVPPLIHAVLDAELLSGREPTAVAQSWRCSVCGYRCKVRPKACPICLAPAAAFVPDAE